MRVRPHPALLPAVAALSAAVLVAGTAGTAPGTAAPLRGTAAVGLAAGLGGDHRDVPVVAHRGAPRDAPEETLASYRTALAQGADVLEGDVQLTADGEPVLLHDDTPARTTDVAEVFPDRADARVGAFTLAEIGRLDAGSWHREEFAGARVPTVEELLRLNRGRAGLTLELKSPAYSPGVAGKLAALLGRYGYDDAARTRSGAWKIMVHSRDEDALREFASVLPEVPLVYLTGGAMLPDAELRDLAAWTEGVFADPRLTTASDVRRAHDAGLVVYNDPVDSPEQLDMALDQGTTTSSATSPAPPSGCGTGVVPRRGSRGWSSTMSSRTPRVTTCSPSTGSMSRCATPRGVRSMSAVTICVTARGTSGCSSVRVMSSSRGAFWTSMSAGVRIRPRRTTTGTAAGC
ncbi:glycerophosphoryl diester phosphodiesterase [Streptomyces griseoviridis]|uniref:Glycerophosphoryl diester phosphodiesterase n=1 Tax=Streptomyces griseoviridis TaxID=45398 RepID=A0ABT9LQ17_STRGD|nr:glycerophosphoryl diester phosphodiesterase [Streptomyces griseoviridis]GGS88920.1 hypothetical protein GCM10010240_23010 [Streptomyces griseoviridis]